MHPLTFTLICLVSLGLSGGVAYYTIRPSLSTQILSNLYLIDDEGNDPHWLPALYSVQGDWFFRSSESISPSLKAAMFRKSPALPSP